MSKVLVNNGKPILFVDHRDSFSANLASVLRASGAKLVEIQSEDLPGDSDALAMFCDRFAGMVLSPGPGRPMDWSRSLKILEECFEEKPVLGVCLGLQVLLTASGLEVGKLCQLPEHGRLYSLNSVVPSEKFRSKNGDNISYDGLWVFYNSLGCSANDAECLRAGWRVHGREGDSIAVAEHIVRPHIGVQFHPESFLSKGGIDLIAAFSDFCLRRVFV